MKKLYFFWAILFALVLTGCQNEDVVSNMAEKESVDGVRSMEDAMKIAQQFVERLGLYSCEKLPSF